MDTFQAIAEPNRRRIIELLAARGTLSATDISQNFHISKPAVSQHLKVLREAHLVNMEKHAQQRLYSLDPQSVKQLEQWIARLNQQWEERFDSLEKVLEDLKNKQLGSNDKFPYFVYVLKSIKDGKYYTGFTDDLNKRLSKHNAGLVPSTKYRRLFYLVYAEGCHNKTDALHREIYLKSSRGKRYIKQRIKNYLKEE